MTQLLDELRLRADAVSGALVVLGLVWFSRRWAKGKGLNRGLLEDSLWYGIIAALAVGRTVWIVTEAPNLYQYPLDLIRIQSGVDFPTAVTAFALMGWWRSRKGRSAVAEFTGLALLLAAAAWAVLCLFRQDCYGRAGPYPFTVPFAQFSEPRLPIGLYEAMLLAAAGPLLLSLRLKPQALLWAALSALALTEFLVEFGRVGGISRFTLSWRWGWLVLAGATVILSFVANRRSAPMGESGPFSTTQSSSTLAPTIPREKQQ